MCLEVVTLLKRLRHLNLQTTDDADVIVGDIAGVMDHSAISLISPPFHLPTVSRKIPRFIGTDVLLYTLFNPPIHRQVHSPKWLCN